MHAAKIERPRARAVKFVMRKHAPDQMAEREIDPAWIERVALHPDWSEPDPQLGVLRHYGIAPEFGGRVLRVVAADREAERHVLTVHFDRGASRRRP